VFEEVELGVLVRVIDLAPAQVTPVGSSKEATWRV
jgi:hypothetical protein